MQRLLILPALLLVVACEVPVPGPTQSGPPGAAPSATCDAVGLSARFLGRTQDEVQAAALPNARVILLGSPITLDFRGERVNFELDAHSRVSRVYCG